MIADGLSVEIEARGPLAEGAGAVERIIHSETESAFEDIVRTLEKAVLRRAPRGATGALRGSIVAEVRGETADTLRGRVFSTSDYARAVELGRPPGNMPPWGEGSPLHAWVQTRLGVAPERSLRVSFLIARKIGRHGTPGRHIFDRAMEDSRSAIDARIRLLGANITERLGG